MTRTDVVSPAEAARPWAEEDREALRCPRCGTGDLLVSQVRRAALDAVAVSYCVGVYDRSRRRFLRRSCGYAARLESAAGP